MERFHEIHQQERRDLVGVDPEFGRGAVGGLPFDGETQPQHALLGDLDVASVTGTPVGDHYHIVLGEIAVIEEIFDTHLARGLLVRHIGYAYGHTFELLAQERPGGEHRGYHRLTVVLRPPSVDAAVLQNALERRGVPFRRVPCGDDIDVGDDPQGALPLPLLPRQDVRPHDGRIRLVRNIDPHDGIESRELGLEIVGLLPLSDTAVDGCQGRIADHPDHRGYDIIGASVYLFQYGLEGLHTP